MGHFAFFVFTFAHGHRQQLSVVESGSEGCGKMRGIHHWI
jgi:hypothetical protein